MTLEKTVYFVRHGQSEGNVAPVFQGPDSPLSEMGRAQAMSVAERLATVPFEGIVTSPFRRASQTAAIIGRVTGKQIDMSSLFVERIKPTSINGKPFSDTVASATWRAWQKTLYTEDLRIEDGENFNDIVLRADAALAFLLNREERCLVVVTHGFFLRTIVARVLLGEMLTGASFKSFQQLAGMENTAITVLRYNAGDFEKAPSWRLCVYNDHAHLSAL